MGQAYNGFPVLFVMTYTMYSGEVYDETVITEVTTTFPLTSLS